jgi:hypothetical protein
LVLFILSFCYLLFTVYVPFIVPFIVLFIVPFMVLFIVPFIYRFSVV